MTFHPKKKGRRTTTVNIFYFTEKTVCEKMPKASRRVVGKPEPLTFNELHGKGITLSNHHRQATRSSGFGDAIIFSSRTVRTYEKVFLKHRQKQVDWIGSLRVGFCMHDPETQLNILLVDF